MLDCLQNIWMFSNYETRVSITLTCKHIYYITYVEPNIHNYVRLTRKNKMIETANIDIGRLAMKKGDHSTVLSILLRISPDLIYNFGPINHMMIGILLNYEVIIRLYGICNHADDECYNDCEISNYVIHCCESYMKSGGDMLKLNLVLEDILDDLCNDVVYKITSTLEEGDEFDHRLREIMSYLS